MPLTSDLFKGNQQLQQCAVNDAAHIVASEPPHRGVNDQGAHVALIHRALRAVMSPAPSFGLEEATETYGPKTAEVVRQFKAAQSPPILNKALRQTVPDSIVGRLTIAALDAKLQGKAVPAANGSRLVFKNTIQQQQFFRKGTEIDVASGDLGLLFAAITAGNINDIERVRRNQIELSDFDDGTVIRKETAVIPAAEILRTVVRTVRATRMSNVPRPGGFDVVFVIIRTYRYIYGPGAPQQSVSVSTTVDVVDSGNVAQPASFRSLHFAKQPADPLDPR